MTPTQRFVQARDFLQQHRLDYDTAVRDYQPPQLTTFNWALDFFDHQARDNHGIALWVVDEDGAEHKITFADMAARFVPLSDALDGLNGALYSETGQHWQGEELWRAIKAIPIAERVQDPVGDSGLPPLYPK